MEQTKLDLPELIFKMVCDDDWLTPWHDKGNLYFTDGRIAIELCEVAPWPGIKCRVEGLSGWVYLEKPGAKSNRTPPNVKSVIDSVWCNCVASVPVIEQPHGTNEKWESVEECEDCQGEGEAECDMGHFHECDGCDGTGTIDVVDDSATESVLIGGVRYAKRLVWIISQLPEAKIGKPSEKNPSGDWCAMPFSFQGGRGALMPMEGESEECETK